MPPDALPGLTPSSAPAGARCSLHPDRAAVATCHRCGAFICAGDRTGLEGRDFCPACAVHPEADHLEAFRLQRWGRRDLWAWVMGVTALLLGMAAAGTLLEGRWLGAASLLLFAAVSGSYFLGQVWARVALFAVPVLYGIARGVTASERMGVSAAEVVGRGVGSALIPLAVVTGMFLDTRNQLFFRLPVSRKALRRAWEVYGDNPLARAGFLASLLGMAVPGLAVLGLALSILGLRRVNPEAHPPIGRAGRAIAGIVLGALGVALWGAILASRWWP